MKIQTIRDIESMHESQDASSECEALAHCSHPYIVPLHFAFHDKRIAVLVHDYYELGDLSTHMKKHNILCYPPDTVVYYLIQLICAVGHLHRKGYIHRDIKPGNLLLTSHGRILLADFGSVKIEESDQSAVKENTSPEGFSKSMKQFGAYKNTISAQDKYDAQYIIKAKEVVGTDGYISPEISYMIYLPEKAKKKDSYYYTKAVDWWSVGATAHKLLTGKKALDNYTMTCILSQYEFTNGADDYIHLINQLSAASYKDSYTSQQSFVGGVSSRGASMEFNVQNLRSSISMEAANEKRLLLIPQPIALPHVKHVSFLVKDLLSRFLDVNFITRLGSGKCGTWNVQSHEIFRKINWDSVYNMVDSPPVSVKTNQIISRGDEDEWDDGYHSLNFINETQLLCQRSPSVSLHLASAIHNFMKRMFKKKVQPPKHQSFAEMAKSVNKYKEWCGGESKTNSTQEHLPAWKYTSKEAVANEISNSITLLAE